MSPIDVAPLLDNKLFDRVDSVVLTSATLAVAGDFGGLKLKPAAQEAARKWDPYAQLTPENACKPPSIIYAMQGPFLLPEDIDEGDWIELGQLGAYGACLRTGFNGFDRALTIEVADPPMLPTPGYDQ